MYAYSDFAACYTNPGQELVYRYATSPFLKTTLSQHLGRQTLFQLNIMSYVPPS